jgi:hypothetical protein
MKRRSGVAKACIDRGPGELGGDWEQGIKGRRLAKNQPQLDGLRLKKRFNQRRNDYA